MDVTGTNIQIAPEAKQTVQVVVPDGKAAREFVDGIQQATDGQALNVLYFSSSLPKEPDHELSRGYYIDLMEDHLRENNILCLTGDDGVGKTNLLAQFARSHPDNCVSFFYDKDESFYLDPAFLEHDLATQLCWYSKGRSNPLSTYAIDRMTLNDVITPSRRTLRNSTEPLYFVFDGFDQIPSEVMDSVCQTLQKVMWNNAHYIFTGRVGGIRDMLHLSPKWRMYESALPHFSDAEVRQYFSQSGIAFTDTQYRQLYELTRGNAGKMRDVWYKFVSKDKLDELWNSDSTTMSDFFDDDLVRILADGNPLTREFFALLAYSAVPLTVGLIADTLTMSEADVNAMVAQYGDYLTTDDSRIRLCPEGFRKFVATRLQKSRKEVDSKLIDVLERPENIEQYCNIIPYIYKVDNMNAELIHYLNAENTRGIMVNRHSLASLNEQCEFGYDACEKLAGQFHDSAFRFALSKTSTRQIEMNELWDNEIEALMSIGQSHTAIVKAQGIYLSEERLKALLLIARHKDALKRADYDTLKDSITQLVAEIDFEKIPQMAVEIAPLLLPIDYGAALKITDSIASKKLKGVNTDRVYTLFSMTSKPRDPEGNINNRDLVSSIEDDGLRQLVSAARNMFNNVDTATMLRQLDAHPDKSQELQLLSYWLPEHNDKPGVGKAVLRAIQLIVEVSDTEMPKAQMLSSIAKSMKTMDKDEMTEALNYIEPLEDSIKYPTVDYVDSQLAVIEAIKDNLPDKALDILGKLYLYIDDLKEKDQSLRLTCMSKLLGRYDRLGDNRLLEKEVASTVQLRKEIMDGYHTLFSETALHLKLLEGSISALVCGYPTMVSELIDGMNTDDRRKRAYAFAANEYLRNVEPLKLDLDYFFSLLSETYPFGDYREKPLLTFARMLSNSGKLDNARLLQCIKHNFPFIAGLEGSVGRCLVTLRLYIWIRETFPDDAFADKVREVMTASWEAVGNVKSKITIGYDMAKHIAQVSKDEAKDIVAECMRLANGESGYLASSSTVDTIYECLELYARSLCQLIRLGLCTDEQLNRFEAETNPLLSESERVGLWGNIALEYRLANDADTFTRLADKYLSTDFARFSPSIRRNLLFHTAPVLFFQNAESFFNQLSLCDEATRDDCIMRTCVHIINKHAPASALREKNVPYELSFHECRTLLTLLGHATDENVYLRIIDTISQSLRATYQKIDPLSFEQKSTIVNLGTQLVEENLPTKSGIHHDGYKIACLAALQYGLGKFNTKQVAVWDERISSIGNAADRVFLYFFIAPYFSNQRDIVKMIRKGIKLAGTIHSKYEESSRMDMAVTECVNNDLGNLLPKVARKAMESLTPNNSYDDYKNLIDTVYQYKPELASQLVEGLDNDTARCRYKKRLLRHIDYSKKLSEARKGSLTLDKLTQRQQKKFFDDMLQRMEDGTAQASDINDAFKNAIPVIFGGNIHNTFSAIDFLLKTVGDRQRLWGDQKELLYKMHDAIRHNLKIVLSLGAVTKEQMDKVDSLIDDHEPDTAEKAASASRKKAVEALLRWYQSVGFDELIVIDPYFGIADLPVIKNLTDINNNLSIRILTHRGTNTSEDYTSQWRRLSSGIRVPARIDFVDYQDAPIDKNALKTESGPLRQRYWICVDDEDDKRSGIKLTVPDTQASRPTYGFEPIADSEILSAIFTHSRYSTEGCRKKNSRPLAYAHVVLE